LLSLTRMLENNFLKREAGLISGKWLDIGSGRTRMGIGSAKFTYADADASAKPDVVMDATKKFPFPDSSFDGIMALNLLEHLRETDLFFEECARVLKKEGALLATIPLFYPFHAGEGFGDYSRWTKQKMEYEAGKNFGKVQVDALGGRYSLLLEVVSLSTPAFLRFIYAPAAHVAFWLDGKLLAPNEKKIGKAFYLVNFMKAQSPKKRA